MSIISSRRQFLRGVSSLGAFGALSLPAQLARATAASAQSGDYKALVCVYLQGGNDSLNTIIPLDSTSNENYLTLRGYTSSSNPGIGFASSGLSFTGPSQGALQVAFNPNLPKIYNMYKSGQASIVANVGPLIRPLTPAQAWQNLEASDLPPLLTSHIDQFKTWEALSNATETGWGGLFADQLAASNAPNLRPFTTVSGTGQDALFLAGKSTIQYVVNGGGLPRVFFDARNSWQDALEPGLRPGTTTKARTNLLERSVAQVYQQLARDGATLSSTWPAQGELTSLSLYPATQRYMPIDKANALAPQLTTIAQVMAASKALGVTRQIFFVEYGGFDTHDNQTGEHAALLQMLDDAMGYFQQATTLLGLWNDVGVFTMSEFGRQIKANNSGTDHGWGAHHLVMGGGVAGGIVGALPAIPKTSDFSKGPTQNFLPNGWMVPTMSVEQYGVALGQWMGVQNSALASIFPNYVANGEKAPKLFV